MNNPEHLTTASTRTSSASALALGVIVITAGLRRLSHAHQLIVSKRASRTDHRRHHHRCQQRTDQTTNNTSSVSRPVATRNPSPPKPTRPTTPSRSRLKRPRLKRPPTRQRPKRSRPPTRPRLKKPRPTRLTPTSPTRPRTTTTATTTATATAWLGLRPRAPRQPPENLIDPPRKPHGLGPTPIGLIGPTAPSAPSAPSALASKHQPTHPNPETEAALPSRLRARGRSSLSQTLTHGADPSG